MKLSSVPIRMYKKYFIILLCVFVGALTLEFIACMMGNPICATTINGVEIIPETPLECLLHAFITSFFWGGIVNFFLTVRIIKEALGLNHWPAFAVVIMTITFALEIIICGIMIIPNIIIFGLKGRIKNRTYEVEF